MFGKRHGELRGKRDMKTKQLTVAAILIALNLVLSYIAKLPTPTGFVSLVEVGIFIGAWQYGAKTGAVIGGMTGFLLDLLAGYPQWMFFSLLIHGAEGYLIGHYVQQGKVTSRWVGNIIGGIVMVLGYWLAGAVLLWFTAGQHLQIKAAIIASLADVPANLMQVMVGLIVALVVYRPIKTLLNKV